MTLHRLLLTMGLALMVVSGCKTSEPATQSVEQMAEDQIREEERERTGVRIDPNRPLVDHLRQFPSLQILSRASGYDVRMRGPQSIAQTDYVLFVINNTPVGQSYDMTATMINMYNVERIDVLTPGFAQQRYGDRGMYGAVVITTRD